MSAPLQPHPERGVNSSPILVAVLLVAALAGCASPSAPSQWYQLRAAPPVPVPAPAPGTHVVQLLMPVAMPELLARSSLLVPQGQAGLRALADHRWAEPLHDAVPRLLRQDLATLLGEAKVWTAPLPSGVAVTRQLRLEVQSLQVGAGGASVELRARWTVSDPVGQGAPAVRTAQIEVPSAAATPDAWVAAHRLALWRLAEQLAQTLR